MPLSQAELDELRQPFPWPHSMLEFHDACVFIYENFFTGENAGNPPYRKWPHDTLPRPKE